jgi:hypothetical protein
MESQLIESGTIAAQEYSQSFFAQVPTDQRFLQQTFHKILPSSSLDGDEIEFNLERFGASNLYLIQETYVEANFVIVKPDGSLPDTAKVVGVVNNVLHSAFESVRLLINDTLISTSAKHYPYKAYINTVLTYPNSVKDNQANNSYFKK